MLVLDANILIRGVLGQRVRSLLIKYGRRIEFFSPDVVGDLIQIVEGNTYAAFETVSRRRLVGRDVDDWPVLATALALHCPIWTEDTDFFGCGVATWTTDLVELYLGEATPE
jgi:predicted nucleic acid-binding protein